MQGIVKRIGIIICVILSVPLAMGEFETLNLRTDAYWKALDFEDNNWTSENYDDSSWEDVEVKGSYFDINAPFIWYPGGEYVKESAYFRKAFNVPGEPLNAEIKATTNGDGEITLYVNNVSLGRFKFDFVDPAVIDIKPYLKPGRNIIAAKVVQPKTKPGWTETHGWALFDGVIRYSTL